MVALDGLEPSTDGNTRKAYLSRFNLGPQLLSAGNYRHVRLHAFVSWRKAVAMWQCLIGDFCRFVKLTCRYQND